MNKWGDVEPTKPPRINVGLAFLAAILLIGAGASIYWLTPVKAMLTEGEDCHDAAEWHMRQAVEQTANQTYHFQAALAYLLLEEGDKVCKTWRTQHEDDA